MTFWDKLGSADSKLTKKSTSFIKARNKLFENPMFFRYVLQNVNVQILCDIVTMYPEAISVCIMKLLCTHLRRVQKIPKGLQGQAFISDDDNNCCCLN